MYRHTLSTIKSHLRFGDDPILGSYLVKDADFIACHNQTFVSKYKIVEELKQGGTLLLNCRWSKEELGEQLPASVKRALVEKQAKLYIIDANTIARELGLGNHASMVLQAAFFRLAEIIPLEEVVGLMKKAAKKSFGKKGDAVVQMNLNAIDKGLENVIPVEIPAEWAASEDACTNAEAKELPFFIKNILQPCNAQSGDELPVSTFIGYEDGTMPMGTSAYEKRGIATQIPVWNSEACIQCNRCSYVCPHAVIRPYLLNDEEVKNAPEGFATAEAKGAAGLHFSLQISDVDCTGCGSCVASCPMSDKALKMVRVENELTVTPSWEYGLTIRDKGVFDEKSVKGSQFKKPLCEFSGACAGCGETPYAKLLTQLYGNRMYWANATGCSQAWGAAMPSIPYTTDLDGRGPAWSNSLFENNAEFSLGMLLSMKQQRAKVQSWVNELSELAPELKEAADAWNEVFANTDKSQAASQNLVAALEAAQLSGKAEELKQSILKQKDQLSKKSVWMFGGDGWAYDIGYGGLDHVVASGEDINIFIIDTEVYSNTGGQSSKATPLGAVAQFQAAGKKTAKKDLGRIMMSYGHCYVASVAMGADPNQLMKAITEAENYPGPSVIIAYAPCINHGIKAGMHQVQEEMKRAVKAGYWPLYRYNPANEQPFTLDSGEPTMEYKEFLAGEVRYASLYQTFPQNAEVFFETASEQAKKRYEDYKKMAGK